MDLKKLRLYQLNKQSLLKKEEAENYTGILKRHIGLHSTDYLTPYLSLWARVNNFNPEELFNDLQTGNVLRLRAFRGTVFVVHKDNVSNILSAAKIFFSQRIKEVDNMAKKLGINLELLENEVRDLLSGGRKLKSVEIRKRLAGNLNSQQFTILHRYLTFKSVLGRAAPQYVSDKSVRYCLMREAIPEVKINYNSDDILNGLILKYVRQFGPVSIDDISWWFPLNKTIVKKNLKKIKDRITETEINHKNYYIENGDYEKFSDFKFPEEDKPVVNFLPYEDHFPKAYYVRNWFLSPEAENLVLKEGRIFSGQIFPSIWMNGEIIGGWEIKWRDKKKTGAYVKILEIKDSVNVSGDINEMIIKKKNEMECFLNDKLIPLMKKS